MWVQIGLGKSFMLEIKILFLGILIILFSLS